MNGAPPPGQAAGATPGPPAGATPGPPAGAQLAGPAFLRLIGVAAAMGIPAALIGAAFLAAVHYLEKFLWTDVPNDLGYGSPPWFLILSLPVAGAIIVVLARRLLPGDGGHRPLLGMVTTPTVIAHAPGIALAALGTLAFGAVLGPEAPVIALGSFVGVLAARAVKADRTPTALLSSAGSFSAISALFGGPVVAGVLLLEGGVGMGAALIPALIPGFVCAAIGYVVFIGLGSWGGLNAPGLLVPNLPPYTSTSVPDLLVGIAVGILTALLITLVRRLAARVERDGLKRLGMTWLLLGGGLAVGALAEIANLLGANSQDVLFSGQASIPAVLAADSTKIILILLVAKGIAYAISLGCGFRGGPIFPAVFLGVGVASLAVTWFDTSPTLALAVGAAAGMAAQTRLLMAPLVFALLLDGKVGIDAIPAAVLATVAAWLTMAMVTQRQQEQPAAAPSQAPATPAPAPAEA